jgi:CheY-like chemotaxis protein
MSFKPIVLVVEDEPLLRMAGADMVENAGFDVVEAANATEAVQILESRPDIRIVFSDIDMPMGLDGMKLAAIIRDRWPPIEIILVSGHVEPSEHDLPHRTVFFSKPYKETEVVAQIRKFAA